MTRETYGNTGTLRSELPRIDTPFGQLSHYQSLTLGEYGRLDLGSFDCPYDGKEFSEIEVNKVQYSGSIGVYLQRDGKSLALDFNLRRGNDWRTSVTSAARTKLEAYLLPIARELFPLPTEENIAATVYELMRREISSAANSKLHSLRVDIYHDKRYAGFQDDIRAGLAAGLESVIAEVASERFEVNTRY